MPTLTLLAMIDEMLDAAIELGPPRLRSLDAIQLASAVSLGDDLGVFVSYDEHLLAAGEDAGLPVLAPR